MSIPGRTAVAPPPTRSQRTAARRSSRVAESDAHHRLSDVERWFIKRGLPHFIEDYRATDDVFNRALPAIVLSLMIQLGIELASHTVTWAHRGIGAAVGLGVVLILFLTANLVRQPKLWYKWPRRVGVVEMTILVALAPVVGFVVRHKAGAAAVDLAVSVGVLVVVYAATAYAVLPVVLWALRHSIQELGNLVNLASKALPMLALFGTFIFLNVDMWHIASNMDRTKLWTLVGFFGVIVLLFLMVRLPEEVRRLQGGYTRESVALAALMTPLERHLQELEDDLPKLSTNRRQRINMLFVLGFTQVVQVVLLSFVVFVYFVSLGKLAVSNEQVGDWLGYRNCEISYVDLKEKAEEFAKICPNPADQANWHKIVDPGKLFGFDARIPNANFILSEPLIQTALLITTFSAFFFAVSAVTDEAYRKDFFESITGTLTRSLDVRCGYIFLYIKASTRPELPVNPYTGHGMYDPGAPQEHQRTVTVPVRESHPNEPTVRAPQAFQPTAFQTQGQDGTPPQGTVPPRYQPPHGARHSTAPTENQAPHTEDPFRKWPQQ